MIDDDGDIFDVFESVQQEKDAAQKERRANLPTYPGRSDPAPFTVQQLARERTEDAFNTVIDIMNDPEAENSTRLEAAKEVLNRGWGKPAMQIKQETVKYDFRDLENALIEHRAAMDEKIAEARRIELERLGQYLGEDAQIVEDVTPHIEGSL